MKSCSRCKAEKSNDYFTKDKSTKDNLSRWCKECKKNSDKRYVHLPGGGKTENHERITTEMFSGHPRNVKLSGFKKRGRKPLPAMTHLERDRDKERNNGYKKRLRKYKITEEQHLQMLKDQNYKCNICKEIIDLSSHIDHCHTKLYVRGILCYRCNLGLGFFRDNKEFLENAKNYLNLPEKIIERS